jgi:hypothetical protein
MKMSRPGIAGFWGYVAPLSDRRSESQVGVCAASKANRAMVIVDINI